MIFSVFSLISLFHAIVRPNCCTLQHSMSPLESLESSDLVEKLDRQNKWLTEGLWGILTSVAVANHVSCLDEEPPSVMQQGLWLEAANAKNIIAC